MQLSAQLRSLALSVADIELKLGARDAMLDVLMDLHNSLNQWSVNTAHEAAAKEVMAILDQFLADVSRAGLTTNQSGGNDGRVSASR